MTNADKAPERILLAIIQDGLRRSGEAKWYEDNSPAPIRGDVSWVTSNEYIRADLYEQLQAENAALQAKCEALETLVRDAMESPGDFMSDWDIAAQKLLGEHQ